MKKIVLITLSLAIALFSINAQDNQQQQPAQKNGKATFKAESYDFGNIKEENGPVTYVFEFTNTGTDPLLLKNVSASCGCTTPEWSKEPILPGKKGSIKVSFNPAGKSGTFEKTITIYSDGNPATQYLKIRGFIETKPITPPDKK